MLNTVIIASELGYLTNGKQEGEGMLNIVVHRLVVAITLVAALAVNARADIAPQGQYLGRNLASTREFMPEPVGAYRTRMA